MTLDLAAEVDAADHVRGAMGGGTELVMYGDFECPYTGAAVRELGRLHDRGVPFQVVFRYFPLVEIHPHAQAAAQAAEAAARQGRFWEMHDILFRNQVRLEPDDLRRFAERLDLDIGAFEAHLADEVTRTRIDRDVRSGEASGVDGTPSLFIDGRRYEGPRDADSLAAAFGAATEQGRRG